MATHIVPNTVTIRHVSGIGACAVASRHSVPIAFYPAAWADNRTNVPTVAQVMRDACWIAHAPASMAHAFRAMHAIARANGRDWKYKLACAWASGRYWELKGITSNSDDACALLQGMRNSPNYGPGSNFWASVKVTPDALQWTDNGQAYDHAIA